MDSPRTDSLVRHSRAFPCPVCDGYANLPKGRGIRCAGFTTGRVCFCTREERAGRAELDITTSPPSFRHLLVGSCPCGIAHGARGYAPVGSARPTTDFQGLSLEVRNAIFGATLAKLGVRKEAVADLTRRGLTQSDIEEVGYSSIPFVTQRDAFLKALADEFSESVLQRCPGFTDKNGRTSFWAASGSRDGYIVPYRDENRLITGLQLKRLDRRALRNGAVVKDIGDLSRCRSRHSRHGPLRHRGWDQGGGCPSPGWRHCHRTAGASTGA